jgi:hypothetical protein
MGQPLPIMKHHRRPAPRYSRLVFSRPETHDEMRLSSGAYLDSFPDKWVTDFTNKTSDTMRISREVTSHMMERRSSPTPQRENEGRCQKSNSR